MTGKEKRISGIAVASLVCGCLFIIPILWPLFSLAAVILGVVALMRISKNKDVFRGKSLAIGGIILGAIWLISFLSSTLSVLLEVRAKAKKMEQSISGTNLE